MTNPSTAPIAGTDHSHLHRVLGPSRREVFEAACIFRRDPHPHLALLVVAGLAERWVEPALQPLLQTPSPEVRLNEDLGLDSLTVIELGLIAEEALGRDADRSTATLPRTLGEFADRYVP